MHRFSIIIVTWNALHHLKRYLPSVAETHYADFEIVIADNNSTDGTAQWVESNYPNIRVATFDRNYGYCGGNNRGAEYANGDILLFLNNDVKVEPDWLEHLDHLFRKYPDLAVAQPKMLSDRKPDQFEYAGGAGGHMDYLGYTFCRGRLFQTLETDNGQYDDEERLFWASGAAFAVKKQLFEEQGGFDENFEFHMEEIDLCWRLLNRGHEIRHAPDSKVYHLGGGSLSMEDPRKLFYNFRNSLFMLIKNYSTASLFKRLPLRVALDGIALLQQLLQGRLRETGAIIKAYWEVLIHLKATLAKRKKLKKHRLRRTDPEIMRPYSIVFNYFIKGKRTYRELENS